MPGPRKQQRRQQNLQEADDSILRGLVRGEPLSDQIQLLRLTDGYADLRIPRGHLPEVIAALKYPPLPVPLSKKIRTAVDHLAKAWELRGEPDPE